MPYKGEYKTESLCFVWYFLGCWRPFPKVFLEPFGTLFQRVFYDLYSSHTIYIIIRIWKLNAHCFVFILYRVFLNYRYGIFDAKQQQQQKNNNKLLAFWKCMPAF